MRSQITNFNRSDAIKDRDIVQLIARLPFSAHGYKFEEVIGSGSFGVVFKVFHYGYKRYFAAKVLSKSQSTDQSQLDCEISILTKLIHPSIIKIYEYFEHQGKIVMILQYCPKGTLKGMMQPGTGIPKIYVKSYMKQILEALQYLHENKIAHLDIKTTNVFIDDFQRPLLGDFGLSQCVAGEIQSYFGSFLYRSPEMIQQLPYDPFKADVWALGVTFYIMVTGIEPFPSFNADIMKKSIVEGKYQIPDSVDPGVSDVIQKMLVVDPQKRPTISEISKLPIFAQKSNISRMSTRNKVMMPITGLYFPNRPQSMNIPMDCRTRTQTKSISLDSFFSIPENIK